MGGLCGGFGFAGLSADELVLFAGAISQWHFFNRQVAQLGKTQTKAKLDALAPVNNLVQQAASGASFEGQFVAGRYTKRKKVISERHDPKNTLRYCKGQYPWVNLPKGSYSETMSYGKN